MQSKVVENYKSNEQPEVTYASLSIQTIGFNSFPLWLKSNSVPGTDIPIRSLFSFSNRPTL